MAFVGATGASTVWAGETPVDRGALVWSADADGNGELTRAEFEDGQVRVATQRFKAFDKDGNGKLSPAEYEPVRAEALAMRAPVCLGLLGEECPNPQHSRRSTAIEDGGVSLQEWLQAGQKAASQDVRPGG